MNVCPVCEHAQASGWECEVCGKALAPAAPEAPAPATPALDLEPTLHVQWDAGAIPRLEGLEPTGHGGGVAVQGLGAGERVPDLEPTRAAPVDVAADVAPDLERTAHAELPVDDALTLPPLPVCRYCRTPAGVDERICARCGMRLPFPTPAAASSAGASARAAGEERRCGCGAPVAAGRSICPACGARA